MKTIAGLSMEINPRIFGIMTAFCLADRSEIASTTNEMRKPLQTATLERADVRITAFYRPDCRGGFLVRARHNDSDEAPYGPTQAYLHLAVVEHGSSTGEVVIFEWIENWRPVPRAHSYPARATDKRFSQEGSSDAVVRYLFERVGAHLAGPIVPRRKTRARGGSEDAVKAIHAPERHRFYCYPLLASSPCGAYDTLLEAIQREPARLGATIVRGGAEPPEPPEPRSSTQADIMATTGDGRWRRTAVGLQWRLTTAGLEEAGLVLDAVGAAVTPLARCRRCLRRHVAPCPCEYIRGRCSACCPGDPPVSIAEDPQALRRWNAQGAHGARLYADNSGGPPFTVAKLRRMNTGLDALDPRVYAALAKLSVGDTYELDVGASPITRFTRVS